MVLFFLNRSGIFMSAECGKTADKSSMTAETYNPEHLFDSSLPKIDTVPTAVVPENTEIKVSVIIPVYDVEKYLRDCLDSIANQTLQEIEIICIDDCSPDDSARIMREYAARDNRVKNIFMPENRGLAYARNTALASAVGKYVLFIDSDDMLKTEALEELYNTAETTGADQLLFLADILAECDSDFPADYYSNYPEKLTDRIFPGTYLFEKLFDVGRFLPSACLKFTRSSLIKENGILFPLKYIHEDNYFSVKTLILANYAVALNKKFYIRRLRQGSIMTSNDQKANIRHVLGYAAGIGLLQKEISQGIYNEKQEDLLQKFCKRLVSVMMRYAQNVFSALRPELMNELKDCPWGENWFFVMNSFFKLSDAEKVAKRQLNQEKQAIKKLKSSFSYRLGRALTYPPRKARSVINSLIKNGFAGTCKNLLKRNKKNSTSSKKVDDMTVFEFRDLQIFPNEKQIRLQQMMGTLMSVWENASDEVLPFVCRKKSSEAVVSVIIPVWNVERYLTKCLQSIAGQTLAELQIICIDNGSTDRSPEILRFFAEFDERFTIITTPNSNAGTARNAGLELATGKYLYFMDADDYCTPDMLETAVDAMEADNCDLVAWEYQSFNDQSGKITLTKKFKDEILDPERSSNLFAYLSTCVWNKLFRTRVVRENGLVFQEVTSSNDVSFSVTSMALAGKIRSLHRPMYFYRLHQKSLQATLINDPTCCIAGQIHTRNELVRLGLYNAPWEGHFINMFYSAVASQLSKMTLSLEQLVDFKKELRKNFDFCNVSDKSVSNKGAYYFIQNMFFDDAVDHYPSRQILIYNECRGDFNKNLNRKQKEITDIKKSVSYRLGRIATYLPRKIIGGIRCLRDHGLAYTCKRMLQKAGLR